MSGQSGTSESKVRGQWGEARARAELEKKGYTFLAANFRCKAGEIDIVMYDPSEDCRVMVEVRLRASTAYGFGSDTVSYQKQRKLIRAAQYYQQREHYWGAIRFDVVSITTGPVDQWTIDHIPAAFGMV